MLGRHHSIASHCLGGMSSFLGRHSAGPKGHRGLRGPFPSCISEESRWFRNAVNDTPYHRVFFRSLLGSHRVARTHEYKISGTDSAFLIYTIFIGSSFLCRLLKTGDGSIFTQQQDSPPSQPIPSMHRTTQIHLQPPSLPPPTSNPPTKLPFQPQASLL